MLLPCIIARVMCIDGLYSFFYYAIVIVILFYCLPEDGRMSSRNMLEGITYNNYFTGVHSVRLTIHMCTLYVHVCG